MGLLKENCNFRNSYDIHGFTKELVKQRVFHDNFSKIIFIVAYIEVLFAKKKKLKMQG